MTPPDAMKFALSYGSFLSSQSSAGLVVIGRDARPSGIPLSRIVHSTLLMMGFHVRDLGMTATPTLGIYQKHIDAQGGIMITASHNPSGWNAIKLFDRRGSILGDRCMEQVIAGASKTDHFFCQSTAIGSYQQVDDAHLLHVDRICGLDFLDTEKIAKKRLKVAVDVINSSGAITVPPLLDRLGVDYELVNATPDGNFSHNPEPLEENISQIRQIVSSGNFSAGFVVDPDVDRLMVIDEQGVPWGEEYTQVMVADYILKKRPGPYVTNLSSTRAVRDVCRNHAQGFYQAPVGEPHVVARMREQGSSIGGEGNGGVIFSPVHEGRDAMTAIAFILANLAESGKRASLLRRDFPDYFMYKARIPMEDEGQIQGCLEKLARLYEKFPINTEDGLKIDLGDEWVHVRKSNTEPILRIFAEASSDTAAEALVEKIRSDLVGTR